MNWFKRVSLKKKITTAFIIASLVSAVIGLFSAKGLNSVTGKFLEVVNNDLPKADSLGNMRVHAMAVARNIALLSNVNISNELRLDYQERLKKRIDSYNEASAAYEKVGFIDDAERQRYEKISLLWKNMSGEAMKLAQLAQEDFRKNEQEILVILTVDFEKNMNEFTTNIKELDKMIDQVANEDSKDAVEIVKTTNLTNLVFIVIASIGLCLFGVTFSISLVGKINAIVSNLSNNSQQVQSTSTNIANSSRELSAAATEQAASLEETTASIEEISAMVAKSADGATTTEDRSMLAKRKATEGRQAVEKMMVQINEIGESNKNIMDQCDQSNQQMMEIVKLIREIDEKTKVINEIVFQTKLLSFNASVEAARAGDHGQGFAVVAEEVGKLAVMSGDAAKDISNMLSGSIVKVEGIVKESKDKIDVLVGIGNEKVKSGVVVANECSNILNEIVQSVTVVSGLAQEIASASKEQSQGVSEINKAMVQLDIVTQQNTQASNEVAEAAESLSYQATSLNNAVNDLVEIVDGEDVSKKKSA